MIEYKKLTEKELDRFIEMRIAQLREEGAKEEIDLRPALKDYYERHLKDGTFVSWLAFDGMTGALSPGLQKKMERSSQPAVCRSWKNRRISAVRAVESACFRVCSPTAVTGERVSRLSF